jgi:hypothetical protein
MNPPQSQTGQTDLTNYQEVQLGTYEVEGVAGPELGPKNGTGNSYASITLEPNGLHHDLEQARLMLYASHALATWGQRMWEFAVGLVMLELQPGSLQLVAISGLLGSAAGFLAGGAVGQYVDRQADCIPLSWPLGSSSKSTRLLHFKRNMQLPCPLLVGFWGEGGSPACC